MKFMQFCLVFFPAFWFMISDGWGKTYPWEEVHPNDFQVVSDILVEA